MLRSACRFFLLPQNAGGTSCSGWAGLAYVGCNSATYCKSWLRYNEPSRSWIHELGHNLRMNHAGTDTNNDGVMEAEYGDSSCHMYVTLVLRSARRCCCLSRVLNACGGDLLLKWRVDVGVR
jgi:hypothetical protein